jgi:hypothetical protein
MSPPDPIAPDLPEIIDITRTALDSQRPQISETGLAI